MKIPAKTLVAAASISAITASLGANLFLEEFDGNTNDYNPNSTTALAGENDWVDFNNGTTGDRITVSDISGSEGYQTAVGGTETVLGGASKSNDPQIRSDFGFGINKADVESFILRIRIDKDDNSSFDDTLVNGDFSLFWASTQHGNPGATNVTVHNLNNPTTLITQSNGWHLATWNIPVGGLTDGPNSTLEAVRIDPTNLAAGNGDSFEIDYFIITGVPEPSSALLIALGGLAMGIRRRRR